LKAFIKWGFENGRINVKDTQKEIKEWNEKKNQEGQNKELKKQKTEESYNKSKKLLKRKAIEAEIPNLDSITTDEQPQVMFVLLLKGLQKLRAMLRSSLFRQLTKIRSQIYNGDENLVVLEYEFEKEKEAKVKEDYSKVPLQKAYYEFQEEQRKDTKNHTPSDEFNKILYNWIRDFFTNHFLARKIYVGFIVLHEDNSAGFYDVLHFGGLKIDANQEYLILAVYTESKEFDVICGKVNDATFD